MTHDRLTPKDLLLLAILALLFFAPGISSLPPIDRDEGRYIQATTQMLETGDFIDVRFMEQKRYKQPVGIYWIQSASVAAFGDVKTHLVWAHRLPSVFNGMIAVLLAGWIASAFFGRKAGLAAGVMLAACFSLNFEARIAKTDATLCMITMALQACLVRMRLDQQEAKPAGWRIAALFWTLMGVGVMIKGPVPLMVSGGTLALLAAWERSLDMIRRLRAFPLALITLAVCLPWLIAIGIKSNGAFYQEAVGKNFLGKVASGQESHGGPPGYHLIFINLMFWPSVLFFLTAIPAIWKHRGDGRVRFLLCWIAPTWLIFELVATKLPHYVLPTYGALAALAAGAWFGDLKTAGGRVAKVLGHVYALLWLMFGLLMAALPPIALYGLLKRLDAGSIAIALFVAGLAVAALVLLKLKQTGRALVACVLAAWLAWINLFVWSGPRFEPMWIAPRVAAAVKANAPCPTPKLVASSFQEASLAFLVGTSTRFINAAQAVEALAADPACTLALIGEPELEAFRATAAARGLALTETAMVSGKNYAKRLDLFSDRNDLHLRLYRATPGAGSSR